MRLELRVSVLVVIVLAAGWLACPNARADDEDRTVYVPRHVIYPGDVIGADDLVASSIVRDLGSPRLFGQSQDDVVGKVARRTLMPSELIPSSAVRVQPLVLQGRPYKLTYKSEFVSIAGTGIPLQSGAAGEMVSVRNPDTNLVIKARIEADQTLTVDVQ